MDRVNQIKTAVPLGTQITHNGQLLRIDSVLSVSGWTSEVYRGELSAEPAPIPVAIKVMKALDLPMARQLFEQEGLTLAAMMYHEEEANKEQRLSLKVAPMYYGQFEYEGMPCLVMELISGDSLPVLLEKKGRLPEQQALTIAWHLYRTLDILHTRLKKTYIDLKFEDLWWVQESAAGRGQLKLLDLGTLEDIQAGDTDSRGVRRDLLLAGVYLCGMLTGHMLSYSLGRLKERADPVINRASMSWGTRQLLRRLLHRNPQIRPNNAAAVAAELRTLVNYWEQPADRLFEIAETNIARAEAESDPQGARAREYASRARAALDLVQLQPVYDADLLTKLIQKAESILLLSSYVARGRALFDGRTYGHARQVFEEGMHWSDIPAEPRRWAYLARIGEEITPEVFDQQRESAVEALERLNQGDWAAAQARLEALVPTLGSPGLDYLIADCQLFANLEIAEEATRNEDFIGAAQAYRLALANVEKLPDAAFVQSEEIEDLRSAAEEMERLQATRGQARAAMEDAQRALEDEDDDEAVSKTWQAYRLDWGDRHVQDAYARLMGKASNSGRLYTALRLAEIGLNDFPAPQALITLRNQIWLLWQANQALQCGDYVGMGMHIRSLYATPELSQLETTKPSIQKLLDLGGKKASGGRDVDGMNEIASLCEEIDFPGHEQWAKALRQRADQYQTEYLQFQRHMVDRAIARAIGLVNLQDPEQAKGLWSDASLAETLGFFQERFHEAERLLTDANLLADQLDYRKEEIIALQKRLNARQVTEQQADAYHQKIRLEDRASRWKVLEQGWVHLQAYHERITGWAKAGVYASLSLGDLREYQNCLLVFIVQGYEYLQRYTQEQDVLRPRIDWAMQALDVTGEDAWSNLQHEAATRLEQYRKQMSNAAELFEKGELAAAAAFLDRTASRLSGTVEWKNLKDRVVLAQAWQAWQQDHYEILKQGVVDQDILKGLQNYAASGLPQVYLNTPLLDNYFAKARYLIRQSFTDGRTSHQSPEFLELIKQWKYIEMTAGMFERNTNHDAIQ